MSDLRLRLSFDVAYFSNGVDKKFLLNILEGLPHRLCDKGLLTGELDAEVDWWDIVECRDVTAETTDALEEESHEEI